MSSSPGRTRPERARSNVSAQLRKTRFVCFAARNGVEAIQNIVPFEIAFVADVVVAGKEFAVIRAKEFDDLAFRPDVELALFAFRIGIERSSKGALARCHLAREPSYGFARTLGE